jgi:D-beta-D-heptose 7-phosphate kinase/D-beta-D-heptose 1-phosphate adenosyltransferase
MTLPSFDPDDPPELLVLGDVMVDRYLWGTCERVSPEAPVQVVTVQRETFSLGGAGNVLANLLALGARASLVGVVGADVAHTPTLELLEQHGARSDGLVRDTSRRTTVKTRVVATPQQIVRFDVETSAAISGEIAAALETRFRAALPGADVVVLSDYGKGVLTRELCERCIALCRAHDKPVLVDPKGSDYTKYRGATLLTPNRREAGAVTGVAMDSRQAVSRAGRKLLNECQLDACLITLSEDGMALFTGPGDHFLPTEARQVFDVTGAGDTVIAAVAFGLACGSPLLDACKLANRAASVVVSKLGAATVTLAELRESEPASARSLSSKIVSEAELLAVLERDKRAGRKIVFTNGCFDVLHAGHVQLLAQAKQLGDVLVLALNSDASVRRLKGAGRPINPLRDRAVVLAGLASVDYIVAFEQDTPRALIEHVLPNVLVKGGDYRVETVVGADLVARSGGLVQILPLLEGRSTTGLLERLDHSLAEDA